MSSGRLFLEGLLASIALLRFTGQDQHKAIAVSKGINYHRTVTSVLTGCLTSRAHPNHAGAAPFTAPRERRPNLADAAATVDAITMFWIGDQP